MISLSPRRLVTDFLDRMQISRGSLNKNNRSYAQHKAWGHIFTNHIEGDYIEFGVYQGDSLVKSYQEYAGFKRWLTSELKSPEAWRRVVAEKYAAHQPMFHGLDTFDGMPENEEGNHLFHTGTFKSNHAEVLRKCHGVIPKDSLITYKGLFTDQAENLRKNLQGKKAAIVNIDSDIYESAKDALQIIGPYIQVGTVLLFDDWNTYCADSQKGERRAFREFQETSPLKFEKWFTYQYAGQAFLCTGL